MPKNAVLQGSLSGNCMLVEVTLLVRYSCSNFTFCCCLEATFWSTWNIQESMFQKIPGVTCSVPCPRVYLNFGLVVFKYQTEPYGFFSSIFILPWKF